MGYTTYFDGHVTLYPPLTPEQRDYVNKFSATRRMHRIKGPYYVDGGGFAGQDKEDDILDYNRSDPTQPGLWCQWVVSDDGSILEWDGGEKFYSADDWMVYLIKHFLGEFPIANGHECLGMPNFGTGRKCNGNIYATGEEPGDHWMIEVVNNSVRIYEGYIKYRDKGEAIYDDFEESIC